ncbi:MAG TPA: hypothetical protein GX747_02920 [Tenericutes bacterium]|nr:hypothetical protein [Mycoplasmatota bacterium]
MEKIKLNSTLLNISENEKNICITQGLKNNNRIIYYDNNIKVSVEYDIHFLKITRSCEEYILNISLSNKKSTITYDVKSIGKLNFECNLIKYNIFDNSMDVIYEIINSDEKINRFEFNLQYEVI